MTVQSTEICPNVPEGQKETYESLDLVKIRTYMTRGVCN